MAIRRIEPGPGQESVWDYPRPPRVEDSSRLIQVRFNGVTLAETRHALRVLETSHPPVYYFPPSDVRMEHLKPNPRATWCEWKGLARYYDVEVNGRTAPAAAWHFPLPTRIYEPIKEYVAFYPQAMEACLVDGEQVQSQEGDFYGGWITHEIVGPFKGGAGTAGW
ncbi:MAG TPA: DUF427 domain-containing protein [Thermoanaerobaculia bacterium]|nr:DUF427 domain-containing protein [Thermoanaerobaculia bacterium]